MDIDGLELISKLNFLDQEDQDQSNMSSNPFDEPNDPVDLNPFGDPDEDGKEWPFTPLYDPFAPLSTGQVVLINKIWDAWCIKWKGMFNAAGFWKIVLKIFNYVNAFYTRDVQNYFQKQLID